MNSAICVDLSTFVDFGYTFDCIGRVLKIQLGAGMCSKVVLKYARTSRRGE